jgi:hypothetical protein
MAAAFLLLASNLGIARLLTKLDITTDGPARLRPSDTENPLFPWACAGVSAPKPKLRRPPELRTPRADAAVGTIVASPSTATVIRAKIDLRDMGHSSMLKYILVCNSSQMTAPRSLGCARVWFDAA